MRSTKSLDEFQTMFQNIAHDNAATAIVSGQRSGIEPKRPGSLDQHIFKWPVSS
jgi:hypothetical protein